MTEEQFRESMRLHRLTMIALGVLVGAMVLQVVFGVLTMLVLIARLRGEG